LCVVVVCVRVAVECYQLFVVVALVVVSHYRVVVARMCVVVVRMCVVVVRMCVVVVEDLYVVDVCFEIRKAAVVCVNEFSVDPHILYRDRIVVVGDLLDLAVDLSAAVADRHADVVDRRVVAVLSFRCVAIARAVVEWRNTQLVVLQDQHIVSVSL
jgi:hypothetical protein